MSILVFLLDPLDEDAEVAEEPTLQDLSSDYFGVHDSGPREEDNNVNESENVEGDVQYSLKKELRDFAVVSATFDRLDMLDDELRKKFRRWQRQLRLGKGKKIKQNTVTDHFRLY